MEEKKFSMRDNPALNATHEALARRALPDWILDHLKQYQEDPDAAQWWDGRPFGGHERTPTLLLTTQGRKSGRVSTMPLIYGKDGGRYVLVGSKGGAADHPAWYLNLLANPLVELQVGEEQFAARAWDADPAERQRLMEMMTSVYPPYSAYQERTDRVLPVVVLERV